jgi:exopolysaccharide production protein ExoY
LTSRESDVVKFLDEGEMSDIVSNVIDAGSYNRGLHRTGATPSFSFRGRGLAGFEEVAKRIIDLLGGLCLLVVAAPIWIATAVLVKLTSPGPVLFQQERLSKGGKVFKLIKFRTMRCGAEEELRKSPAMYKRYVTNNYKLPPDEDPRLTKIGGVLRSTSVDELPQLLNVLRGEMSLVGPRPIVPAEIGEYGDFAPFFLSVKPGMTGLWQISGRSEIQDYRQRIELELEYIRSQSVLRDLKILVCTIPSVLRRRGAY